MGNEGGICARLELLATLGRRAEDSLRRSSGCFYQDTDSVFVQDSEESRELVAKYKKDMNDLHGRFGVCSVDDPT